MRPASASPAANTATGPHHASQNAAEPAVTHQSTKQTAAQPPVRQHQKHTHPAFQGRRAQHPSSQHDRNIPFNRLNRRKINHIRHNTATRAGKRQTLQHPPRQPQHCSDQQRKRRTTGRAEHIQFSQRIAQQCPATSRRQSQQTTDAKRRQYARHTQTVKISGDAYAPQKSCPQQNQQRHQQKQPTKMAGMAVNKARSIPEFHAAHHLNNDYYHCGL